MKVKYVTIIEEAWPEAQNHGLGGDERSAFLRATISDGKGGEEDIGQCGLEVLRCTYDGLLDDSGRNRPILSGTLFVETPHRRKGVGIRLLRECEGVARRWGFGEMLLMVQQKNKAALSCYEKVGYVPVAEPTRYHGTEICLRRNLYSPDIHTVHSMMPQRTDV